MYGCQPRSRLPDQGGAARGAARSRRASIEVRTVPKHEQTERFTAWFSWATVYAERIDPLQRPAKIAKAMDPEGPDADEE
jgi:hypothetical protein